MTEPISQRRLEKLRLGELPEDEAAELISQLEAKGELHRLESLIEDDEAFLENHPAAMMAIRIREGLRRNERAGSRKAPQRRNASRLPAFVLAALVLIIGFWLSQDKDPPQKSDIAAVTDTGDDIQFVASSKPTQLDPDTKSRTVTCVIDQELRFIADGVVRVVVDDESIASGKYDSSTKMLDFVCKKPGTTRVINMKKSGLPEHWQIRVGVKVRDVEIRRAIHKRRLELESCGLVERAKHEGKEVEFMVTFDPDGSINDSKLYGGTAPKSLQECVMVEVRKLKLQPTTFTNLRVASIRWKVRFARRAARAQEALDDKNYELASELCAAVLYSGVYYRECGKIYGLANQQLGHMYKACKGFARGGMEVPECAGYITEFAKQARFESGACIPGQSIRRPASSVTNVTVTPPHLVTFKKDGDDYVFTCSETLGRASITMKTSLSNRVSPDAADLFGATAKTHKTFYIDVGLAADPLQVQAGVDALRPKLEQCVMGKTEGYVDLTFTFTLSGKADAVYSTNSTFGLETQACLRGAAYNLKIEAQPIKKGESTRIRRIGFSRWAPSQ